MKKVYYGLIALFALICVVIAGPRVGADSGWSSSYSSGGGSSSSSSSSSSWSSSSYSSSSYDGSSYSGESTTLSEVISVLAFIAVIAFFIIIASVSRSSKPRQVSPNEISEEELKKVFPDETLESVREMAYTKFIDVQNAWMEFDYDSLKKLCSNELANSYIADLDVLKLKNGKNVMSDFTKLDCKVTGAREIDGVATVDVYLYVKFRDYVIDAGTEKVIRGSKNMWMMNAYTLKFTCESKTAEKAPKTCPNCGAKVKDSATSTCEFCRATIVKTAKDFVLTEKTKTN